MNLVILHREARTGTIEQLEVRTKGTVLTIAEAPDAVEISVVGPDGHRVAQFTIRDGPSGQD